MSNKAKLSTSNIEPETKGDKHTSIQKIAPVESTRSLSLPLPPGFETSPVNEDVIDAIQRTKKIQRTQRAQKTQRLYNYYFLLH